MQHIIKNLGNFSVAVSEGMIGYGRETPRGRGRSTAVPDLPSSDGYATKEADIVLGGFIQRRVAQESARNGTSWSTLNVQEQERLAYQVWKEHLATHGTAGPEYFRHWLVRVKSFAKQRSLSLPEQRAGETEHTYSRRLRKWISHEPDKEKWPAVEPAAGTHLVLSPDPKVFQTLRERGGDERLFLKHVLAETMKEFSDWRRGHFGTGHSLGWVAGTHVRDNGADKHPHVHLVVLKRDEAGKAVDWSVTNLKGRHGRSDPDPMLELKRVFSKQVEKVAERTLGKSVAQELQREPSRRPPSVPHQPESFINHHRVRQLAWGLRAVFAMGQPDRRLSFFPLQGYEIGFAMRFVATVGKYLDERKIERARAIEPEMPAVSSRRFWHRSMARDDRELGMEPGD